MPNKAAKDPGKHGVTYSLSTRKHRLLIRTPAQLKAEDRGRRLAQIVCAEDVCRKCKRVRAMHVHHINGDPLDNRPKNLAALCAPCHQKHHRSVERRKLRNWVANIDAVNESLGWATVQPQRQAHPLVQSDSLH